MRYSVKIYKVVNGHRKRIFYRIVEANSLYEAKKCLPKPLPFIYDSIEIIAL
ncbi:MAG: hypothetical protein QXI16_00185 [Sulfolobaceae archaeon]